MPREALTACYTLPLSLSQDYEKNVSFVTVHTSGHMVPQFKPQAAQLLFGKVMMNEDLSPPMNETEIASLSDAEFFGNGTKGYLTEWILRAQSAEYSTLGGREEEPH